MCDYDDQQQVSALYECQQIRSYKSTAVVLFTEKKAEQVRLRWSCCKWHWWLCWILKIKIILWFHINNFMIAGLQPRHNGHPRERVQSKKTSFKNIHLASILLLQTLCLYVCCVSILSSGAVLLLCSKCHRCGALHRARGDLSHEEKRWFEILSSTLPGNDCQGSTLNPPRQCCFVRRHGEEGDGEDQQHRSTWRRPLAGQLRLSAFCQREGANLCHAGESEIPGQSFLMTNVLLQSAPEAPSGRHINVYTYSVRILCFIVYLFNC